MKITRYELQSTLIVGGIQSTVWELSRELCAYGHNVHLYSTPETDPFAGRYLAILSDHACSRSVSSCSA